jgi:hypothetical protein
VLAVDRLPSDDLDPLLQALGGGLGLGLGHVFPDELGVLDVRQPLEAGSATEVELDDVGQVGIARVEEASRLAGHQGQRAV